MKKFANLLILFATVLFTACSDTVETPDVVEVRSHDLEGVWKLEALSGTPLAENTYVYVVLDRKYAFEVYDNTASMYPVLTTGEYELTEDWRLGYIISGTYDYGLGAWGHEYVITELSKESMVWTAKDDAAYAQRFVRVNEVPKSIVDMVRKE